MDSRLLEGSQRRSCSLYSIGPTSGVPICGRFATPALTSACPCSDTPHRHHRLHGDSRPCTQNTQRLLGLCVGCSGQTGQATWPSPAPFLSSPDTWAHMSLGRQHKPLSHLGTICADNTQALCLSCEDKAGDPPGQSCAALLGSRAGLVSTEAQGWF